MSTKPGRWQWQPISEHRWDWVPEETGAELSARQSADTGFAVHWPPFGQVDVDLAQGIFSLQGHTLGKVRQVPTWWGDANLAAGVLVACQVPASEVESVEFLLGVESRPWWPTPQVGPLWGLVDPNDEGLTAAMAREATEEGLGVLGSQDQLQDCLESECSAPVSFWPWQSNPRGPRPAVLRMVSLGPLSCSERQAVVVSFSKRRHRALAAASVAASALAAGAPAVHPPHLEVEDLIWVKSGTLLDEVQARLEQAIDAKQYVNYRLPGS